MNSRMSLALAAVLFLATGCGAADIPASSLSDREAVEYVDMVMHRGHSIDAGTGAQWSKDAIAALPDESDVQARAADLVVLGTVVDVEPIAAYTAQPDDAGGTEVEFDRADALWRTVSLRVHPDRVLAGTGEAGDVRVTYSLDGGVDVADFRAGITALPRSVYYLYRDAQRDVWGISRDGALVLRPDRSGSLTAPYLTDADAREFLSDVHTLRELEQAAAELKEG